MMSDGQMQLPFDQVVGDVARSGERPPKLPKDQSERVVIREDLDRNLMVLAGAGAGKTHELVERVIGLVRQGGIPVTQIAAITFTRKAAGELRSRVYDRLQEELRKSPSETIASAVERIDQCFIGTIHAFCSRLLRERPLEAGLPFDFKELDERDEPRARRKAWVAYRNERLRAGDPRLSKLLEIHFDSAKLFDFFTRRCQFPELDLKPTTADEPALEAAAIRLSEFVAEARRHWVAELDENPDSLANAVTSASDFLANRGIETEYDRFAFISFFDRSESSLRPTLKRWASDGWAKQAKDEIIPTLLEEVVQPAVRSWKRYVYTLIVDVVNGAKSFYDIERRRAGAVTFEDLLIRTAALLRDNPDVRTYFARRYKAILVDEFQDTDPVQAEVLMYLTSTDPRERDWQKAVPRPGSLFVVGDEKQSIYRFRRADVETFRFVRDRIKETGGRIVELNTSFRSLGNLCGWLNGAFGPVFGGDPSKYQADYSPLLEFRPGGTDPVCVRAIRHEKPPAGVDLAAVDAARIGDFIKAAHESGTSLNGRGDGAPVEEPVSFGDFMILTRTKKHLNTFAKALEARGIPYDMVGGGELGQSQEIRALTEMLEALADPGNPIPLVSYLRGRLVGLGDDELLAIREEVGRFDYRVTGLKDHETLDPDLAGRLSAAYSRLRNACAILTSMTPSAAFEEIVEDLGIIPWASADEDRTGSSRAGGLIRLLANVRRWERMGLMWMEIVAEIRAMIDGEFAIPGITLESGHSEVVQLMNLHQAKGLQAKVVFLAAPYDTISSAHPPDFHVSRFEGKPYLSIPVHENRPAQRWVSPKTIAEPAGWEEDKAEEERFLEAEENRLRYVAATRARNLLVISTVDGNRGGPWGALAEFLSDVPDMEVCPPVAVPDPEEGVTELESLLEPKRTHWDVLKAPSWIPESVAADEDQSAFVTGERRGTSFGSAVHQVLDDLLAGRIDDVDSHAASVGAGFGLSEDAIDAVRAAVGGFTRSQVFRAAQESTALFTEVPFAVFSAGHPPTVTRGRIDLVFKSVEGWHIIDFKTDAVASEEEIARILDHYRQQVAAYADHWSDLAGEPVVQKGVWLTARDQFVPID